MKKITVKVSDEDYNKIRDAMATYGFRSEYEFAQTAIKASLTLIYSQSPPKGGDNGDKLTAEVDEMFRGLIVDDTSESTLRGINFVRK